MEALIVLGVIIFIAAPIITLVMLSSVRNRFTSEFDETHKRLDELTEQLKLLRKTGIIATEEIIGKVEEKPVVKPEPVIEKPKVIIQESPKPKPSIFTPPKIEDPIPLSKKEPEIPKVFEPVNIEIPKEQSSVFSPDLEIPKPPQPPKPGFFERNPDLEKFIGENLANKIGIGILVIGIGFFVKYAIDQEWINEIGRVFIGILCGGILLGVAHRLRKTFDAFSSVLVGGGIAVLYLTIYIAFHSYGLFSQTVAFMLMVGITGFAVLFSLAYNKVELAVVALLGGFASPLMVSTGEGNYVVLFTYITILDVGMLVLSYYKKWTIVNIISYLFTILLFATWLGDQFEYQTQGMTIGALIFATIFYLVFFAMNLINNLKERKPFGALEFALLLSNTFLYYGAGMYILNHESTLDYRGLFTVALGLFNFIFAYTLFKTKRVDKNLVFLLIGLVLTFISLAAPIQLKGNYITLFWAAEAVLLLWLSQKSGIRLMKLTSHVVLVLMVISLVMDLFQVYGTEPVYNSTMEQYVPVPELMIIFNKGYLTCLFAVASFVGTILLLRKEKPEESFVSISRYRDVLSFVTVVLVFVMNLIELSHHLSYTFAEDPTAQHIAIGGYNMLFILVLLLTQKKITTEGGDVRNAFAFLGVIAVFAYLGVYYSPVVSARYDMITQQQPATGFLLHYIMVALIIPICAISITNIKKLTEFNIRTANAYSWFYVAFFVFLASSELDNIVLMSIGTSENMDHVLSQNHKIGFPILWGITSFLLIAIGMKWRLRHLRIISLTLFLITLIKLFAVDIRGISEGGKIAAFISLGILLLTVSFMYQRLKKLLLVDDAKTAEANENKPVE